MCAYASSSASSSSSSAESRGNEDAAAEREEERQAVTWAEELFPDSADVRAALRRQLPPPPPLPLPPVSQQGRRGGRRRAMEVTPLWQWLFRLSTREMRALAHARPRWPGRVDWLRRGREFLCFRWTLLPPGGGGGGGNFRLPRNLNQASNAKLRVWLHSVPQELRDMVAEAETKKEEEEEEGAAVQGQELEEGSEYGDEEDVEEEEEAEEEEEEEEEEMAMRTRSHTQLKANVRTARGKGRGTGNTRSKARIQVKGKGRPRLTARKALVRRKQVAPHVVERAALRHEVAAVRTMAEKMANTPQELRLVLPSPVWQRYLRSAQRNPEFVSMADCCSVAHRDASSAEPESLWLDLDSALRFVHNKLPSWCRESAVDLLQDLNAVLDCLLPPPPPPPPAPPTPTPTEVPREIDARIATASVRRQKQRRGGTTTGVVASVAAKAAAGVRPAKRARTRRTR